MIRIKTQERLEFPPFLLESQIIALSALAEEGPTNIYQIQKKTGKTYSLMFKAVKDLERRSLVKLVEKKQTSKGTTANIYDLTLMGVLTVLEGELPTEDTEEWNYDRIHKIIRKYESLLPLVFGKWSYFQSKGVEKVALYRLHAVVFNQSFLERADPWVPGTKMEERICWFFYFYGFFPATPEFEGWRIMDDAEAWAGSWAQDKDIKAYVVKELAEYQTRLKTLGGFVERHILRVTGSIRRSRSVREFG